MSACFCILAHRPAELPTRQHTWLGARTYQTCLRLEAALACWRCRSSCCVKAPLLGLWARGRSCCHTATDNDCHAIRGICSPLSASFNHRNTPNPLTPSAGPAVLVCARQRHQQADLASAARTAQPVAHTNKERRDPAVDPPGPQPIQPGMAPQRTVGAEQDKEAQEAEQQRQLAAAEKALLLLLQHDSIRTQLPVACTLLCCSKALAAAVAEHSVGQLDVPWLPANIAEQAAPWLRKHARLLRSLDLSIDDDPAAGVAPLIAAGPQSLALQSLRLQASNATLPLLEQLPASRFTYLGLRMKDWSLQLQARPAFVARVSAALGRLTALRNLELYRHGCGGAAPLSGLSALTQLTALSLYGPVSDLQHAPPQLLELDGRWTDDEPPLDLRHLAAVTALSLLGDPVKAGDLLPPNLLRLEAYQCRSVQPLLPLVQLQHLDLMLEAPLDITADQLRQLSRLTALSLHYDVEMDGVQPASAGAWSLLPLQQLKLASVILSAPVCQHLAQLTGLTSLALRWCRLPQAGSAQQLAAALRQLSGLQQLELWNPLWPATASDADKAAGTRQLVQAICSLQRLRDLRCSGLAVLAAAAAGATSSSLSAFTALTALSLYNCDLTDVAVTAIMSQLPGLQSLDCGWSERLTDAALPAIGQLQQLTQLDLINTSVTDAGLQYLGGLTRLQKLELRDTHVSNAGMRHLTTLTRLHELSVPRDVAMQQRRWLQRQLPHLTVI